VTELDRKETAKRYILAVAGVFLAGIGVAVTRHGNLGVSPISSVGNVMSIKYEDISLGYWLLIWNILLIIGQIIILRKNFKWIQLLQIPLSILFGWFTDFGVFITAPIPVPNYAVQIIMVVVGMVILAFGISVSVTANVIMNSGEAFVKAISDTVHKEFGFFKVAFDICCVAASVVVSFILFGSIVGTREGTIITAVFTGFIVKFISGRIKKPLEGFILS
jgi:uncharacterized membrane protein YczE